MKTKFEFSIGSVSYQDFKATDIKMSGESEIEVEEHVTLTKILAPIVEKAVIGLLDVIKED